MDLTPTQALGLSPSKESGNRDFFFVIHWGAMDLGKWIAGIWRESAGIHRESGSHSQLPTKGLTTPRRPVFPLIPAEIPHFNR